jgi:hypothetical protein
MITIMITITIMSGTTRGASLNLLEEMGAPRHCTWINLTNFLTFRTR